MGKIWKNDDQPISTMRFWDRSLFGPGHVRQGVTGPPSHSVRPLRSSTDRMLGPRRRDLKNHQGTPKIGWVIGETNNL